MDDGVVLVPVRGRGQEHEVGRPLAPQRDEVLQDPLAVARELADLERAERDGLWRDPERGRAGAAFIGEHVSREAVGDGLLARREREVVDLDAGFDEADDGARAAELVVGVRAEDEGAAEAGEDGHAPKLPASGARGSSTSSGSVQASGRRSY